MRNRVSRLGVVRNRFGREFKSSFTTCVDKGQ
jgi:hypothetical protein